MVVIARWTAALGRRLATLPAPIAGMAHLQPNACRPVLIDVESDAGRDAEGVVRSPNEADMERELGKARQAFPAQPAVGGFVIHHNLGYRRWPGGRTQRRSSDAPVQGERAPVHFALHLVWRRRRISADTNFFR
jgi:hypothetical protein